MDNRLPLNRLGNQNQEVEDNAQIPLPPNLFGNQNQGVGNNAQIPLPPNFFGNQNQVAGNNAQIPLPPNFFGNQNQVAGNNAQIPLPPNLFGNQNQGVANIAPIQVPLHMLGDIVSAENLNARTEKFKSEGLVFSDEDYKWRNTFASAFCKFINEGTQDEVQEFIDQISNIKDRLGILQNYMSTNLCATVLTSVNDIDRKTQVMQAIFDAGMEYSSLKRYDGTLFLYSSGEQRPFVLDDNSDKFEICQPYLKAILSSKNYDKFTDAVQDLHLGQLNNRGNGGSLPVIPDFITIGIQVASEYLRDNPLVGRDVLKPFYESLNDPTSVLAKYCNDIDNLASENSQELQRLNRITLAGLHTFEDFMQLQAREKNVGMFQTLQNEVGVFKEEFQKIPSLLNIAENTINGVIKDNKSIVELPLPEKVHNELIKNYNNTIHPQKREAYNQEQSKLDKFAKFTQPQNSLSKGAQAANNKTESKHDQTNNKSAVRRKSL